MANPFGQSDPKRFESTDIRTPFNHTQRDQPIGQRLGATRYWRFGTIACLSVSFVLCLLCMNALVRPIPDIKVVEQFSSGRVHTVSELPFDSERMAKFCHNKEMKQYCE